MKIAKIHNQSIVEYKQFPNRKRKVQLEKDYEYIHKENVWIDTETGEIISSEEKEKIIKEIEKLGVVEGCRKYGISATTYYEWDRKYKSNGLRGLSSYNVRTDKDYKRLEKENSLLKELVVAKELQLQLQVELLKKKMEQWKTEKK